MTSPVLSVAALSATKAEGSGGGTTPFTFTVTRTGDLSGVSSDFWTWIPSAGTPAADASDFTGATSGTVTFAPGVPTATVTLNVTADNATEGDEKITVILGTSPTNATIDSAHNEAFGVIQNDDSTLADLSASNLTVNPNSVAAGGSTTVSFSVTDQTIAAASSATGFYLSSNSTFDASDTLIATRTTAGLTAGQTVNDSVSVPIPINTVAGNYFLIAVADYNNQIAESNENNNASNAVAITIGSAVPQPVLAITPLDANKAEGSSGGTTPFTFAVTRTGSGTSSATWTVFAGSTNTADGNDFSGAITGTVNFTGSQTSQTITVNVIADTAIEASENFGVSLSNASGATIDANHSSALAVIQNDDFADFGINNLTLIDGILSYRLVNSGTSAGAGSTTGIYISVDSTINTSDTLIATVLGPSLSSGASDLESISVYQFIPTNLVSGTYYIGAVANYNGSVAENSLSNNSSIGASIFLGDGLSNRLNGGSSGDILDGLNGNDFLNGFAGLDYLIGGRGADIFIFESFALTDARSNVAIFDHIVDYDQGNSFTYSFTESDQIDLTALLSTVYNHGSGQSASSLVRAVEDFSGTFAYLQIDVDGAANGVNWITIAQLDGFHFGNNLSIILDASLSLGSTITTLNEIVTHDFNGDSKSDILWRSDGGTLVSWDVNDGQVLRTNDFGGVPSNWTMTGTGDFNGDGKVDLLWRSAAGTLVSWDLNDGQVLRTNDFGVVPSNWKVVGTGDFNGDGKSDFLWRSDAGTLVTWDINDGQVLRTNDFGAVPTNWKIVGTGDFNGDGKSDLVLRSDAGTLVTWDMNDGQVLRTNDFGVVPSNWKIAGTGDFNGDGKSDLVLRSDAGTLVTWDMNDGQVLRTNDFGVVPSNWKIAGTGDFNGDGKSDLLWRSDAGTVATWNINDGQVLSTHDFGVAPTDWHIL